VPSKDRAIVRRRSRGSLPRLHLSSIHHDAGSTETEVDFVHYVTATKEIVEDFRDILAEHTAKMDQKAIKLGGQTSPEHIAEKAELHRLGIGCDNFLNVLAGNY
jgi:hypothetical protein